MLTSSFIMIKLIPVFGSLPNTHGFIIAFTVFWCQRVFSGLKLFISPLLGHKAWSSLSPMSVPVLLFQPSWDGETKCTEHGSRPFLLINQRGLFLNWTLAKVEYKSTWPFHFSAFKGVDFTNILKMCFLSFEKSAKSSWIALPWEKPASHRIRQ